MGWFRSDLPGLDEVTHAAKNGALPELIEKLQQAGAEQAWLARALRVDLTTIMERPELAFPCVWNRTHGQASRQQLLDSWKKEHGSAPWARSLRPPRFGLEGALREEYRADFEQHGTIGLDLQFVHAVGIAWDRRTGQRVELPRARRSKVSDDWKMDYTSSGPIWGRCRIVAPASKTVVLDVRVNDVDNLRYLAATSDGRSVVAGGWFDDGTGTVCLFDAEHATLRWRTELDDSVNGVAISDDARTVVAFSKGFAVVLDGRSGSERRRLFVDARHGALDASGQELVTQTLRAMRVWDLSAPDGRDPVWSAAGQGWVDAAFSPDGKRLLTGPLLCDAQSGALVAQLQTRGPDYLEDRPPTGGRSLCNDRFVELSPVDGVMVWDAATGQPAPPSAQRPRFSPSPRVCFSHDARFVVCDDWREAVNLRVIGVDDGADWGELPFTDVITFQVDPTLPRLATAHVNGCFRIWELPGLKLLHEWGEPPGSGAQILVYSLDGSRLVAQNQCGLLRQWRLSDGARLGEFREVDRSLLPIHDWEGFVQRWHPYVCFWDGGFLLVQDDRGERGPIAIPCEEKLELDASGTRAAFRYEHFALER